MKRLILGAALLLCAGCVDPPPNTPNISGTEKTGHFFHDASISYVPYGFSIYTYRGNEYLVARGVECISITPCLPPKAEKEPGHAE